MSEKEVDALVSARLRQAQEALDDAKYLLDGRRSPQSIVNRSYYAMFYAALALLQKTGKAPTKHAGVISLFDTEFVLTGAVGKEFSRDFHRSFELRQMSDYKVTEPCSPQKASEILSKAVRFVSEVSRYLGHEMRES